MDACDAGECVTDSEGGGGVDCVWVSVWVEKGEDLNEPWENIGRGI